MQLGRCNLVCEICTLDTSFRPDDQVFVNEDWRKLELEKDAAHHADFVIPLMQELW
jgi:hypothetical protein